jgi:ammonia channel protein AmtB
MNELSIFVIMAIVCILWASITYSVGFKEGQRQGYARGRSVSRHASSREVTQ